MHYNYQVSLIGLLKCFCSLHYGIFFYLSNQVSFTSMHIRHPFSTDSLKSITRLMIELKQLFKIQLFQWFIHFLPHCVAFWSGADFLCMVNVWLKLTQSSFISIMCLLLRVTHRVFFEMNGSTTMVWKERTHNFLTGMYNA